MSCGCGGVGGCWWCFTSSVTDLGGAASDPERTASWLTLVVDEIERGGGIGLGFQRCVNQAKVVAVTGDVVASGGGWPLMPSVKVDGGSGGGWWLIGWFRFLFISWVYICQVFVRWIWSGIGKMISKILTLKSRS